MGHPKAPPAELGSPRPARRPQAQGPADTGLVRPPGAAEARPAGSGSGTRPGSGGRVYPGPRPATRTAGDTRIADVTARSWMAVGSGASTPRILAS